MCLNLAAPSMIAELPSGNALLRRQDLPPAPRLLSTEWTVARARATLKRELLGERDYQVVATPLGNVEIREGLLAHISQGRQGSRERFSKFIIPTLQQPDEIWLSEYQSGRYFRKQYFKIFQSSKGRNMFAVVRENTDGTLLWTVFRTDQKYLDKQRIGALLYSR